MSNIDLPEKPFKGIKSFQYADRNIYAEREDEKYQIISLVQIFKGSVLYGKSGSGKSSLIGAGFIPLVENNYNIEVIRVFPKINSTFIINRILKSEANASYFPSLFENKLKAGEKLNSKIDLSFEEFKNDVHKLQREKEGALLKVPLIETDQQNITEGKEAVNEKAVVITIEQNSTDNAAIVNERTTLIIFDQFEELVTLFEESQSVSPEEAKEKTDLQLKIIGLIEELYYNTDINIKMLFAFREDYLARFSDIFVAIPDLLDHRLRLTSVKPDRIEYILKYPFSKDENKTTYTKPFTDKFCEELATKLKEYFKTEINLTEIQIVCEYLYSKSPEERDSLLGPPEPVKAILENTQVEVLKNYDPNEYNIATTILTALVLNDKTRNIVPYEGLLDESGKHFKEINENNKLEEEQFKAVLTRLENDGIIRKEKRRDGFYYEITSESIIPFIISKKTESQRIIEKRDRDKKEKIRNRKRLIIASSIFAVLVISFLGITYQIKIRLETEHQKETYELKFRNDSIVAAQKIEDLKLKREKDSLERLQKENAYNNQKQSDSIRIQQQDFDLALSAERVKKAEAEKEAKDLEFKLKTSYTNYQLYKTQLFLDSIKKKSDDEEKNRDYYELNPNTFSDVTAKKTVALYFYKHYHNDTTGEFQSEIYRRLIAANIGSFGRKIINDTTNQNNSRYKAKVSLEDATKRDYNKTENLYKIGNSYYVSAPFRGIYGIAGGELKNVNKNILHSWINNDDSYLATLSLNEKKVDSIKTLDLNKVTNLSSTPDVKLIEKIRIISSASGIISLLFSEYSDTMMLSLKLPNRVYYYSYKNKIQKIDSLNLPEAEYYFIIPGENNDVMLLGNRGSLYSKRSSDRQAGFICNLNIRNNVNSAVTGYAQKGNDLFTGYENGMVYKWIAGGKKDSLYYTKEKVSVTAMAISDDGQWLAAGYHNGRLTLINLKNKTSNPIDIFSSANYGDQITAILFTNGAGKSYDSLIVSTKNGYVYIIPLSSEVVAKSMCRQGDYYKEKDMWDKYIQKVPYEELEVICDGK